MKTEPRTVNKLFELDVRYVVPLYQRPYVWGEVAIDRRGKELADRIATIWPAADA